MSQATASPVLFESIGLPSELDGSSGANRVKAGYKQIAANTDDEALKVFLARYADTKTTFENYRKEIERLYLKLELTQSRGRFWI